jgi:hypothetical protein
MLVVMVVMVFGNIVLRYGFNSGIISSEETVSLPVHLDHFFSGPLWRFVKTPTLGWIPSVRELAQR